MSSFFFLHSGPWSGYFTLSKLNPFQWAPDDRGTLRGLLSNILIQIIQFVTQLQYMLRSKQFRSSTLSKKGYLDRQFLYAQNLSLKEQLKQLSQLSLRLKTHIHTLQKTPTESSRLTNTSYHRKSASLLPGAAAKKIIHELNEQIIELKNENQRIKRTLKHTRLEELITENALNLQEATRLRDIIEQLQEEKDQIQIMCAEEVEIVRKKYAQEKEGQKKQIVELRKANEEIGELKKEIKLIQGRRAQGEKKWTKERLEYKRIIQKEKYSQEECRKIQCSIIRKERDQLRKKYSNTNNHSRNNNTFSNSNTYSHNSQNSKNNGKIGDKHSLNKVVQNKIKIVQKEKKKEKQVEKKQIIKKQQYQFEEEYRQKQKQNKKQQKQTKNVISNKKQQIQHNLIQNRQIQVKQAQYKQFQYKQEQSEEQYKYKQEQNKQIQFKQIQLIKEKKQKKQTQPLKLLDQDSSDQQILFQQQIENPPQSKQQSKQKRRQQKQPKQYVNKKEEKERETRSKQGLKQIRQTLEYKFMAQRYAFSDFQRDIKNSKATGFTIEEILGILVEEPFLLEGEYLEQLLEYLFGSSEAITTKEFISKMKKFIGKVEVRDENQEMESLRKVAKFVVDHKHTLIQQFDDIQGELDTTAFTRILQGIGLGQLELECALEQAVLVSVGVNNINYNQFIQRMTPEEQQS